MGYPVTFKRCEWDYKPWLQDQVTSESVCQGGVPSPFYHLIISRLVPFDCKSSFIMISGGTQFPAFDPTSKVDLVFLCCFPCLFLIFSIVYVIAFYF